MCAKKTTKKVAIVDDGTKFPDSLKGGHAAEFTGGKELVEAFNEEVNRITNENKAPVIGEEVSFIEEKIDDVEQPKHFAEIAETNRAVLIQEIYNLKVAKQIRESIVDVALEVFGCKYNYLDFQLMLRFMEKGLFLYKDTVALTINGEEVTKEGCYVLSNTFNKQITNTEDHIVQLFETYDEAVSFIDNRIFTGVPSIFRNLFSETFREGLCYAFWLDALFIDKDVPVSLYDIYRKWNHKTTDKSRSYLLNACGKVIHLTTTAGCIESYLVVEQYLKQAFTTIVKDHYCPHCDMFVNSVKGYTINYPGDSDEVVYEDSKDPIEKFNRYEKTYACNNCFKQHNARRPITANAKVNRNDLCSCGSGLKYKKCCGKGK